MVQYMKILYEKQNTNHSTQTEKQRGHVLLCYHNLSIGIWSLKAPHATYFNILLLSCRICLSLLSMCEIVSSLKCNGIFPLTAWSPCCIPTPSVSLDTLNKLAHLALQNLLGALNAFKQLYSVIAPLAWPQINAISLSFTRFCKDIITWYFSLRTVHNTVLHIRQLAWHENEKWVHGYPALLVK